MIYFNLISYIFFSCYIKYFNNALYILFLLLYYIFQFFNISFYCYIIYFIVFIYILILLLYFVIQLFFKHSFLLFYYIFQYYSLYFTFVIKQNISFKWFKYFFIIKFNKSMLLFIV